MKNLSSVEADASKVAKMNLVLDDEYDEESWENAVPWSRWNDIQCILLFPIFFICEKLGIIKRERGRK